MGICEPQPEYDISLEGYSADIAVYVVGRYSGEGNDRDLRKGDFYLTETFYIWTKIIKNLCLL